MTPKEKATAIVEKYLNYSNPYEREKEGYGLLQFSTFEMIKNAKQCALICVEEIQSVITRHDSEYVWNYWKQVKTEIEKL